VMRSHWTTALMLATAATLLLLWACGMDVPGTPLAVTADTQPWHDAVGAAADAWRADPTLPSIDTSRCADALAHIDLRMATEREWLDDLPYCPMTEHGCSTLAGCSGSSCVTGTVYRQSGAWRVLLSPGEDASGHAVTVRHEVAHVLSWCTSGDLDYAHAVDAVWRTVPGVVWCGCPREGV